MNKDNIAMLTTLTVRNAAYIPPGEVIQLAYTGWTLWQKFLGLLVGRKAPKPKYVRVVKVIDTNTVEIEPVDINK